ncbi:DUF3010 family protein [Gayadomonas joobiniege]|uniref:DUF3010 family protein n=1 Tax=Gayadomonas joobiniege TaxID=1234606 RepID=UPI00037D4BE5|nr:DUF3010 family protein [Gayadomonas joobiniege]
MKVCGVELTASEANICLVSFEQGLIGLPECRSRKLVLKNATESEAISDFQFAFKKLMQDYSIDEVVIKTRQTKGKFAGSAAGFKMEAAIQLIPDLQVSMQAASTEKAIIKKNPLPISFKETGLKGFQESAFISGYTYLMAKKYGLPEAE